MCESWIILASTVASMSLPYNLLRDRMTLKQTGWKLQFFKVLTPSFFVSLSLAASARLFNHKKHVVGLSSIAPPPLARELSAWLRRRVRRGAQTLWSSCSPTPKDPPIMVRWTNMLKNYTTRTCVCIWMLDRKRLGTR